MPSAPWQMREVALQEENISKKKKAMSCISGFWWEYLAGCSCLESLEAGMRDDSKYSLGPYGDRTHDIRVISTTL